MWIPLTALLVLSLAPAPTSRAEEPTESEARAADAVEQLGKTHHSKEIAAKVAALREFGRVPDEDVCKAVGKFLKDHEDVVFVAACEALRFNADPAAVPVLEKHYKSHGKQIQDDATAQAAFMKALGWQAANSSVDVLTDKPFSKGTTAESVRARILGLGKIRTVDALDGLVGMVKKVGRRKLDHHIEDVRIALHLLTGTDQGNDPDLWARWWQDAKRDFEVPPEVPKLSAAQQTVWNEFWGLESESGDDGEG